MTESNVEKPEFIIEKNSRSQNISQNEKLGGIKLRNVSYIMLVAVTIIYATLIYKSIQLQESYSSLFSSTNDYLAANENAARASDASDYLTSQVRMFSIELDRKYVDNYFHEANVERRREASLENLRHRHIGSDTIEYFTKALKYSNELMDIEYYAMRLVIDAKGYSISSFPAALRDVKIKPEDAALSSEQKIWRARIMLFDSSYHQYKALIKHNLELSFHTVADAMGDIQRYNTDLVRLNLIQQLTYITILFFLTVAIFGLIIYLLVRPLRSCMESIKTGNLLKLEGPYEFRYLANTYNSIFERNTTNQELLRHKTEHDFLTGLMNRSSFVDICDMLRDNHSEIAMILVDIDAFKAINDKYGHDIGDKVLQKLSRLIVASTRTTDNVFRLGGDIFGILMAFTTAKEKDRLIERFNKINEYMVHPTDGLPATNISMGVAFSTIGYHDKLYHFSEQALHQAKIAQSGGIYFYPEIFGKEDHTANDI